MISLGFVVAAKTALREERRNKEIFWLLTKESLNRYEPDGIRNLATSSVSCWQIM